MTTKNKFKEEIREKDKEIAYLKVKVEKLEDERKMRETISHIDCKMGEWCDVCKFGNEITVKKGEYAYNRTVCMKAVKECKGFRPIDDKE